MTDDDPFARLGLPRRHWISEASIREAQRRALARLHPDREQDPLRKATAMRESAAVSAAARDLIDPVRRAEILLRGAGVEVAPTPPPELLMSSLEWRESLEEAKRGGDAHAIFAVVGPIEERMFRVLRELNEAIDGPRMEDDSVSTPREQAVFDPPRAAALLTEFRLLRRVLE